MGITISEQQHHLEENKADRPNRGYPSKPGQYDFCDQRLYLKKEKGAQKNYDPIKYGWLWELLPGRLIPARRNGRNRPRDVYQAVSRLYVFP